MKLCETNGRGGHGAMVLVAMAGLAMLGGLAGCDRKDATLNLLNDTARTLHSAGNDNDASRKAYSEVTTSLAEIARNGDRSSGTAALMISVSQLGLSEADFQKYLAAEAQSLAISDQIRSSLSKYLSLHEAAKGADAFSVAGEMGRINAERARYQDELNKARTEKSTVDQQITTLRSDSKSRLDAANAKLADAAKLTENLAKMSAAEGASAMQAAYDIKVQAEKDRKAGLELEAQASLLQPVLDEWTLKIGQFEHQLANLLESEKSLQEQERLAKQSAADARTDAGKAANRISDLVREEQELRAGALDESATKALATLKKALDATRELAKPTGNAGHAALLVGVAQQSIGELQASRASGHAAYVAMLQNLIEVKPPLPAAADYSSKAEAATKAQSDASEAAKTAFEEAQRGFDRAAGAASGPSNAATKEQLKALAARCQKLAGKAGDSAADASAEAAPAAPAPAAPEAIAAEGTTMDPALRACLEQNIALVKSFKGLDDAMKEKFGKGMSELAAGMPGGGQMMGGMGGDAAEMAAIAALNVDSLKVTINGNKASVEVPGGKTLDAMKVGGTWMMMYPGMEQMLSNPQAAAQMAGVQKAMASLPTAVNEITADIRSGKISTPDDVMKALMGKLMQGMMPPGGG